MQMSETPSTPVKPPLRTAVATEQITPSLKRLLTKLRATNHNLSPLLRVQAGKKRPYARRRPDGSWGREHAEIGDCLRHHNGGGKLACRLLQLELCVLDYDGDDNTEVMTADTKKLKDWGVEFYDVPSSKHGRWHRYLRCEEKIERGRWKDDWNGDTIGGARSYIIMHRPARALEAILRLRETDSPVTTAQLESLHPTAIKKKQMPLDQLVNAGKPDECVKGNRNNWVNREGHIAGLKQDEARREDVRQTAIAAGLPIDEVNKTVDRAYAEGLAKSNVPTPKNPNASTVSIGDTSNTIAAIFSEKGIDVKRDRLPEVARFLGTRGHVTLIAGLGGVGKTSLLLYAGHCVATGTDFFSERVEQGKVIIITNEDKEVIKEMMTELPNCYDIHIHDGNPDIIGSLRKVTAKDKVSLILIDPATVAHRWFGVKDWNENSSAPWEEFIDGNLKPLAKQTDALVVLLHHTTKQPRQGSVTARAFIRGSGNIVDMADNVGVLLADGNARTLELVKRRGLRRRDKIRFELQMRELSVTFPNTGETETFHAVTGGKLLERGLPLDELINFSSDSTPKGETLLRELCKRMHEKKHKYGTKLGYMPQSEIVELFSSQHRQQLRQSISNLLYNNSQSWDDNSLFKFKKTPQANAYCLLSGPDGPCPNGIITDISLHVID